MLLLLKKIDANVSKILNLLRYILVVPAIHKFRNWWSFSGYTRKLPVIKREKQNSLVAAFSFQSREGNIDRDKFSSSIIFARALFSPTKNQLEFLSKIVENALPNLEIISHVMRLTTSNFDSAFEEFLNVVNFCSRLQKDNDVSTVWHVDKHKSAKENKSKDAARKTLRLGGCAWKLTYKFIF